MASNARPAGLPGVPVGEHVNGQGLDEAGVDVDATLAVSQSEETGVTTALNVSGSGVDEYASDDDTLPSDIRVLQGSPPGWPAPPPAVRADGWDSDSTAAWNPASAWAAEDAVGPDSSGGPWDEVPNWEGEIVKWEADHAQAEAGPLALTATTDADPAEFGGAEAGWSGAPTAPPGQPPDYLPAHLRAPGDAVAVYAGPGGPPAPPVGIVYDRKGYDRKDGQRAKRQNGPWRELVIITAVAVIVSAVILGVTTAEKSNLAGIDGLLGLPTTTTVPATAGGASSGHTPAVSTQAAKSATALTTDPNVAGRNAAAPPTLSQGAKSLPVTPGVAQSLVSSWLASNPGGYGMGPADVGGTLSNQVHYGVQPATGTYWALAAFKPSAALSAQSATQTGQAELAEFHDSVYAFSWQAGPVWTLLGEFSTGSCPGVWVPRAVLAAWGLCGL
jgi:hypothetical protein